MHDLVPLFFKCFVLVPQISKVKQISPAINFASNFTDVGAPKFGCIVNGMTKIVTLSKIEELK